MTNGAVIAPDSASVNLNSTTKASIAKRHVVRQKILERADRRLDDARQRLLPGMRRLCLAPSARGSVAISAVTVPISTSAAIAM